MFFGGVDLVRVEVSVADGNEEFAGFEAGDFCDHEEELGVLGDVERKAEEDVAGPLVELHIEFVFDDAELEHGVARWETHFVEFGGVPGGDEDGFTVRGGFDLVDCPLELVDAFAVWTAPVAPLDAVNSAEVAVFVCETVPDVDFVVVEVFDVIAAGNEPEHFVGEGFVGDFFGCEEREAVAEVEAELRAEDGFKRADATGLFSFAISEDTG